VRTSPELLTLRVDESLYFANARSLEDRINDAVASRPALRHVVLQCSAINEIDASALESLEAIDKRMKDAGVLLHFSELKGPVMDRLRSTELLQHLRGQIFMSQYQAVETLSPDVIDRPAPPLSRIK
jgi:SulP family sulfate permease